MNFRQDYQNFNNGQTTIRQKAGRFVVGKRWIFPVLLMVGTIGYFAFWWTYKLSVLPGLHGDEAWSGLKAIEFKQNGITQAAGMNTYTGILQALLCKLTFDRFGTGVAQLRASGVAFNLIGILMITTALLMSNRYKWAAAFVLIIAQSALYLVSPRIAWEVNSFTLFFAAVVLLCSIRLYYFDEKTNGLWIFVFLLTNIIASYNHIIFATVGLSALASLLLWGFMNCGSIHIKHVLLLAINLFNLSAVYLTMNFFSAEISKHKLITLAGIVLVVVCEKMMLSYWKAGSINYRPIQKRRSALPTTFFLCCVLFFLVFHGIAFFEVLSNSKILLQTYSYETSLLFKVIFIACGLIIFGYLIKFIIADLMDGYAALPAYFIIIYLGVLTGFTQKTSYRYYLLLILIVALYLAYKISTNNKSTRMLQSVLLLSFIQLNVIQLEVFFTMKMPVKAIRFFIGNGQPETSEHFLPKEPLIDFLSSGKIGQVWYNCDDPYFLDKPLQFYKIIKPWPETPSNKAIVGYNYYLYKHGYTLSAEP